MARVLGKLGVDPRRFWLLMDLFEQLAERGEMTDQLGRNGVAMKSIAVVYCLLSAFVGLVLVVARPAVGTYLSIFLGFTAFLLTTVLISEAGNSLINPQEALVLAHQPIDGATYIAAKLSHLMQLVLYFVPAVDLIPALAGLGLKGAPWYYPAVHMAAALLVGLISALVCCSFFGWLVRFVPVPRLRAAGQLAGTLPFLGMTWGQQFWRRLARLRPAQWAPAQPEIRLGLEILAAAALVAAVAFGIRALSADYLIRVSALTKGGASAGSRVRRSRIGAVVRRSFGGQEAVAGFAFVSRLMLRDWQFRRQAIPLLFYAFVGLASVAGRGWPSDPFSAARFSTMHLLPHVLGGLLFFVCGVLPYGNDFKGVWIFQSISSGAIDGFARGIFAVLWIDFILIPHLILLPPLIWLWGISHAALFITYSLATASVYLALELRLIEDIPFSKQVDNARQALALPLMMAGGLAAAAAVAVQHFLIFGSPVAVAATSAALGVSAYLLTKSSLDNVAVSMRYHLGTVYHEVDV